MIHTETIEVSRGYDRKTCWVHARCGWLDGERGQAPNTIVVTLQKSYMSLTDHIHDVFSGIFMMRSDDGGHSWSSATEQPGLARWVEPDGIEGTVCDFTPQWHRKTKTLIGIGTTSYYQKGKPVSGLRRRETAYSVFNAILNTWEPIRFLKMPEGERFSFAGAGCVQWVELPNGDLLLPIYFIEQVGGHGQDRFSVAVFRCTFDGKELVVRERGDVLALNVERGFVEPSLIECAGQFWLTLRNDLGGYVSVSNDGLNFETPKPWAFCNGEALGSYNTQQHWIRLNDRLFLVYTRKGLDNDHVPRHRAPLLMAEVDQKRRIVLRDTERILVLDRGAQLGNFGVVQKGNGEAWVCVSEWMENAGDWNQEIWGALRREFPEEDLFALAATPGRCKLCELSGSDNSIYLVRVSVS